MSTTAVEVIYRGIFQRTMAKHITRGIVLAARKEGKVGIAFGRYGDSPERNGIPAKQFAIVAANDEELQGSIAKYEPTEVDVTIAVDDALCKGVESWAWYGLQPVNKLLKENGTLIVTSIKSAEELIPHIHKKDVAYNLAIIKGKASFSGLWVYKNDHTDMRMLGALPRVAPHLFGSPALEAAIREQIRRVQEEAIAPAELERVKAQVAASNVFTRDSVFYQAMQMGMLETVGLDWKMLDHSVERVRAVTAAQVQAVAKKYLTESNLTVTLLDPQPGKAKPRAAAPLGGGHVR